MSKFTIKHITIYKYDQQVHDSANQIMLYPIKDDYQEVVQHQLNITNEPQVETFSDYYDNTVGTFTHPEKHRELFIESSLVVIVKKKPSPDISIFTADQWNQLDEIKFQIPYINFLRQEQFLAKDELKAVIKPQELKNISPLQIAKNFCSYVFENFTYIKGITSIETTVDEIWKMKSGVCQDFAHILLVMLRHANIPARYVSGYICPNKNGMRGEGATHAWVEAFIPDYGWLGLDPTNNCIVDENHVRLAVGRNFEDVSPVKGTYKGTSSHTLEVKVIVSYENDPLPVMDEIKQDIITDPIDGNSYRRFMEMQQQQ